MPLLSRLSVFKSRGSVFAALWVGALAMGFAVVAVAVPPNPLQTTINDWKLKGTQPTPPFIDGEPNPDLVEFLDPQFCAACHGNYNQAEEPYTRWQHSMMGQAFRDPVFRAAMSIGNQDAMFVGDTCIRCHAPQGWVQARNLPTDGSALDSVDKNGVSCHACHRMVDPDFKPGISPSSDFFVLLALEDSGNRPDGVLSNAYVMDPKDRRRGPYQIDNFFLHQVVQSPHHRDSSMCASCHDVSNQAFVRQPDGTYALTLNDAAHPTLLKYDMFPEQRTYSEWLMSSFAQGPVELGSNRYGGQIADAGGNVTPRTAYASCQDCHMPSTTGQGCEPFISPPVRNDLPLHNFNGANSWVLRAVNNLYPQTESYIIPEEMEAAIARNNHMMAQASDLELSVPSAGTLRARVVNQTGHKLPTGYPEGRRMWVNVKFFDAANNLIAERGVYNNATAAFDGTGTKVYETKHGIGPNVAAATGLPAGESFHLALNNVVLRDNRIPPRGFTNAGFASVQAEPVAYSYADGQFWDDTDYAVPPGAARAEVRVFHQTSTKEYMEFLRDEDVTIPFDRPVPWGLLAYQQWTLLGRSAPVLMDFQQITFATCTQDYNASGSLDGDDLADFIADFFDSIGIQQGFGEPIAIPGGFAGNATLNFNGFGRPCPTAVDVPQPNPWGAPIDAYRTGGYKNSLGINNDACSAPNGDDLADYISVFFNGCP